ncbi:TetR/AcrR family transcriptional regulator [Sulfurimonas sp. HSL3-7]|uniref:TetR/AcrR family transcriptional regulator n=1 Tax=Sulfonitrofixus jiaomeiensis TaxID=3131938 RepID=UPI0031F7DDB0
MSTKQKILDSALELFNATNTQAATTNHIAKAMGISPGNLHYHYKNREAIILKLYEQMLEESTLLVQDLPKDIVELFEHQKVMSRILWRYRFFYRELLFLLSRDPALKERYIKDNIAHRERIRITFGNLVEHGDLNIPYDNILEQLTDTIMLVLEFWNPMVETLGKDINEESFEDATTHIRGAMRPYLTKQALDALKVFKDS